MQISMIYTVIAKSTSVFISLENMKLLNLKENYILIRMRDTKGASYLIMNEKYYIDIKVK